MAEQTPAITTIRTHEFDRLGAARHPAMLALDGWYLGVLLRDRTDNDYSFAVLGPDPKGAKRWIGGGDSIKSIDDARGRLLTMLQSTASRGKRIHEQD